MRSEGFGALVSIARRSIWIVALARRARGRPDERDPPRAGPGVLGQRAGDPLADRSRLGRLGPGHIRRPDPDRPDRAGARRLVAALPVRRRAGTGVSVAPTTSPPRRTPRSPGARSRSPRRARAARRRSGIVNLVANSYPAWRAAVSSRAIDRAIALLQAQLRQSGSNDADLQAQLSKLRVLKTLTSGNVLLVEPADSATKTRPRPVKDSLLGGFIGLFVALLVIGLREALDSKVRSEEEIEDVLDVPVLGAIESLPRKVSPVISDRDAERYGDMYSLLAASLVQQREGNRLTVIAVTSATAEEGKTTTAVNLAAALARRNARVKLLDLDTRRPSLAPFAAHPARRARRRAGPARPGERRLAALGDRDERLGAEGATGDGRQHVTGPRGRLEPAGAADPRLGGPHAGRARRTARDAAFARPRSTPTSSSSTRRRPCRRRT